ncbi:MAG: SMP-30/gluconolactonase/LRE family protein, partial [Bacteroidota bacterium]
MRKPIFFLLGLLYSSLALGQVVETLIPVSVSHSFEAISWHTDGRIYSADLLNNRVNQINLDGSLTTVLPSISSPLGGAFDPEGNFYVSEYNTGKVWRLTPDGTSSVLATGLDGSAGILVDTSRQRLFVADYDASLIATIDLSSGALDTLVRGGGLNGPDGMVYAPNGDLIVCNFNDNRIHRVTMAGEISLFTTVTQSPNTGYIVNFGDNYLVCGFDGHQIWRLSADGQEVSLWAGAGNPGHTDGSLAEATFLRPNGIALSPTGDTLIVNSGVRPGGIRLIAGLNSTTSTQQVNNDKITALQLLPNPVVEEVTLKYTLKERSKLGFVLLTPTGREILVQQDSLQQAGQHAWRYTIPASLPGG